jgi:hypothetical protein
MKHACCSFVIAVVGFALICPACQAPRPVPDGADTRRMIALLMPKRVEIVEPFTRVQSADGGTTPTRIELLIQAVNTLDNPGLMITGSIRVELYEYVSASGDAKGRRLEFWNIDLDTEKQQNAHWNAMTQMYEFHLGITASQIPQADRYVLAITYNSPMNERLTDECLLRYVAGNIREVG